jgi:hypothetical protein
MSEALLLELAVGVLPRLPLEVLALRDDGGTIGITILEPRDTRLYCSLSALDAREGLKLTIPVDTDERGGYSIGCEIDQIFFMGGLDSAARLIITEVTRRKAYRAKDRIDTTDAATLYILGSAHHPVGECLIARVVDISPGGIGLTSESPLDRGDRVRIDTVIEGITIHTEALVVQTSTAALAASVPAASSPVCHSQPSTPSNDSPRHPKPRNAAPSCRDARSRPHYRLGATAAWLAAGGASNRRCSALLGAWNEDAHTASCSALISGAVSGTSA